VLDIRKGYKRRQPIDQCVGKILKPWRPLEHGQAKLNVDGAFTTDGAGSGMILQDEKGEVIFASCRSSGQCRDATETEIEAIKEGVKLALQWKTWSLPSNQIVQKQSSLFRRRLLTPLLMPLV
jgi:hypothetical protein